MSHRLDAFVHLFGVETNAEIARRAGVTPQAVNNYARSERGHLLIENERLRRGPVYAPIHDDDLWTRLAGAMHWIATRDFEKAAAALRSAANRLDAHTNPEPNPDTSPSHPENPPMSSLKVPIQPFDDRLRERLRKAIQKPFQEEFEACGADYNPDTTGRAVDGVIAVLAEELLGVRVTLAPQRVIGNGTLVIDPSEAPPERG